MVKRNYSNKDVVMLLTASTIVETAILHLNELQSKRPLWAPPFFDTIKTKIDYAFQNYLGIDSAKHLRQSSLHIRTIQTKVLRDLAQFKVQISEDFKSDKDLRDTLLSQLGFTSYHKQAKNGDTEALIDLLYQFRQNLTPEVKSKILMVTAMPASLPDGIIHSADELSDANVNQETYKSDRTVVTQGAIIAFNDIYDSIISVCKIAVKFFTDNSAEKSQFSYNKVSKAISRKRKSVKQTGVPVQSVAPAESANQ